MEEECGCGTHSEREIGSDGELGAEVNAAVGVADRQRGVAGGQGLGSHPAAVSLAWRQPPWNRRESVRGRQEERAALIHRPL